MKLNKFLLTSALGLAMTSLTQAGNVYISGSTAMRNVVYNTLVASGAVFTTVPAVTVYHGSVGSPQKATYMAFYGTLVGGSTPTTLYTSWSGSEAGILNAASNNVSAFWPNYIGDGVAINTTLGTIQDNSASDPATFSAHPSDLAMGDNDQPFSRTKTPVLTTKAEVGVITFEWLRNHGQWYGSSYPTNITESQIRQAMGSFCKLAVFTGNSADVNNYVYVSGRNNGSGTRVNAFGTSGWGIFTSPKQIMMDTSGNMQDLSGDGSGVYAGDYGFESGGDLSKTLGADTSAKPDLVHSKTGFSVIAYAGVSDANTAIGLGAEALMLDGVQFTPANVIEGRYTYWGNEYIFAANSVTSGTEAKSIFDLLSASTGIPTYCDGVTAINLNNMHCTRQGPTSDPAHN